MRSVLEIGIGGETSRTGYDTIRGGMSLRMWQTYFPNATIVGLDIEAKHVTGDRIIVERGSQDNPAVLIRLAQQHGPFDIVIDDGSHIGRHIAASFKHLFEHVKPGGVYIIEDLANAYDPNYEGGPPGTSGTQVDFVRSLVDDVLRRHWDDDGSMRRYGIESMHIYDQIVFIYKQVTVPLSPQ